MTIITKRLFPVILLLALSFSSVAPAQQTSVLKAYTSLENVINNNIPAAHRTTLIGKLNDVQMTLTQFEDALNKLDNVVNNNIPSEHRAVLKQKIKDVKKAIAHELRVSADLVK